MSGSRSNSEQQEQEDGNVADTDQVKRGLKSLRNRRQQLEDAIDSADIKTRKPRTDGPAKQGNRG